MSASLVGSEMCIRDRPPPGLDPDAPRQKRTRAASVGASPSGSSPPTSACLLYTSDAADDM
eukprot:11654654-Alexandrium_andersonii.AAC.1